MPRSFGFPSVALLQSLSQQNQPRFGANGLAKLLSQRRRKLQPRPQFFGDCQQCEGIDRQGASHSRDVIGVHTGFELSKGYQDLWISRENKHGNRCKMRLRSTMHYFLTRAAIALGKAKISSNFLLADNIVIKFPQRAGLGGKDQGDTDALYDVVYLKDTDKPLPETINYRTRYAYFKTIARGGKSLIMSCKDLHLSRVVCYKTLRPELANDPIEQQRLLRGRAFPLCCSIRIRYPPMKLAVTVRESCISP